MHKSEPINPLLFVYTIVVIIVIIFYCLFSAIVNYIKFTQYINKECRVYEYEEKMVLCVLLKAVLTTIKYIPSLIGNQ